MTLADKLVLAWALSIPLTLAPALAWLAIGARRPRL